MTGTVIEILSTRKLVLLVFALLSVQIVFFSIGGIVAPKPSDAREHIMTSCKMEKKDHYKTVARHNCLDIGNLHGDEVKDTDPDQIVFMSYIPQPQLAMIPWFQYLLALLQVKITFNLENKYKPHSPMLLNVSIFYSNEIDYKIRQYPAAWNPLANCEESRVLECTFAHEEIEENKGDGYECDVLHLFQLGSVPHKYYLVNLRLPIVHIPGSNRTYNLVGQLEEMTIIAIRQTGGFTKVWMCLKTALTVIMIFPVVWFWKRISILERKPMLIEKAIFSLGVSMLFLNLPLELVSIYFEAPWMLFFTDVRQGFFYAVLLSFWIIFTGEHLMDLPSRNKISAYKWQLGAIFTSMMALLTFDIAERGMQLVNPCATVWTHHDVAMALLIIASFGGCMYFLLLLFMVVKVFRAITYKRRFLLSPQRQKRFKSIVLRFHVLMVLSVATAGLTVMFYVLSQKYDGILGFGDHSIQVNSAFFTGVYGLWNIYIFLVLSVYAPSHKHFNDESDEQVSSNGRQALSWLALDTGNNQDPMEQTRILDITRLKERED